MGRAALFVVAALALAGCGASREEFRSDANAVCSEQQAEVDKLRRPGVLELFQDYFGEVVPIVKEQRARVGELDVPADDAETRDELLEQWDEVITVLEDGRERAASGSDIGIVITLRRAAAAERGADEAARELGLDACVGFNPFTR